MAEAGVLLLQPPLLLQRLFPAPFQLPGHQPVLRLGRVVLPPGPLGLVAGPLQLLQPVLVQPLALLPQVVRRRQAQLQGRRRQRRQDLVGDQVIEGAARQPLASGLRVVTGRPAAAVAHTVRRAAVGHHQPPPAAAADEQSP